MSFFDTTNTESKNKIVEDNSQENIESNLRKKKQLAETKMFAILSTESKETPPISCLECVSKNGSWT